MLRAKVSKLALVFGLCFRELVLKELYAAFEVIAVQLHLLLNPDVLPYVGLILADLSLHLQCCASAVVSGAILGLILEFIRGVLGRAAHLE